MTAVNDALREIGAEARIREATTTSGCTCRECVSGNRDRTVKIADLRDVLSLVDALRAANAEQAQVIARLSRPSARAGDVAAFIRDPDELGKVTPKGGPCATCEHMATDREGLAWCCLAPDGVDAESIRESHIGLANWLCEVVDFGCYAHKPKGGAK